MLVDIDYNRAKVLEYAKKWAFGRNPKFYNFDKLGGDCTNFASQCIYAGCDVMNFTPVLGWYYNNINSRSPSWAGVEYLYKFLTTNWGAGPYAEEVSRDKIELGDIIQLQNSAGLFYHTLVVVGKTDEEIYVATHTRDSYYNPLSFYFYHNLRYLHILGARKYI